MGCEFCDGKSQLLRVKMDCALLQRGIEPLKFIEADYGERLQLMSRHFGLGDKTGEDAPETKDDRFFHDLGMVVIKPEMHAAREKVKLFLSEKLGVKILWSQEFVYTPQEYWRIYGQGLLECMNVFPHGALLLLLSITAPSEIVFFRHRSVSEYEKIFAKMNNGKEPQSLLRNHDDPQYIFDKLFVRHESNSLRSDVCTPEMEKMGLLSIEPEVCPGVCWDFTASFSQRLKDENARTFNGVHSPKNRKELLLDFSILCRILKSNHVAERCF